MPSASGGASSKSIWTSAGIFFDSVGRNEPQASIPKLRAFATSTRLSTTINEGRIQRPPAVNPQESAMVTELCVSTSRRDWISLT
jgi:hypothetical protein